MYDIQKTAPGKT